MYYTYMLRCEDNSIYTGITTDLERRMEEHFSRNEKCAKYTLRHKARKLEIAWRTDSRVNASKLEYHIKTLSKSQKEELLKDASKLELFLSNKIDTAQYRVAKEQVEGVKKRLKL